MADTRTLINVNKQTGEMRNLQPVSDLRPQMESMMARYFPHGSSQNHLQEPDSSRSVIPIAFSSPSKPPDPPDFNKPDPLSEIKAVTELSNLKSKTRKRKLVFPLKFSCDEIYDRMTNGLCIFCEEQDTPDHQLKHKGFQILMKESDDPVSDDKNLVESALEEISDECVAKSIERVSVALDKKEEQGIEQEEEDAKNTVKDSSSLPNEYQEDLATLIKPSNDVDLLVSQEFSDSHISILSSLEMVHCISGINCNGEKYSKCLSRGDRVWEPGGLSSQPEPQTYHVDDDMFELTLKLQHKQSQVFKKGCEDELMYGDEFMQDSIPPKLGPLLKFLRPLSGDTTNWKNIQSSHKCDDFLWGFHGYTLSTETKTLPLDCHDLVLGVLFVYEVAETFEKLAKTWQFKFKASSEKIGLVDVIFSSMEEPSGEVNTELDAQRIVICKRLGKKPLVGGQKMETKDNTLPAKLHVSTTIVLSGCSEAGIRFDSGFEGRNTREILMNEAGNQMTEDSGDAQMEVKTMVQATIVQDQEKPMKLIVLLLTAPSTLSWSYDMYISFEPSIEELNPVRLKLELPQEKFFVISKNIGLLSSLEENIMDIIKLSKQREEVEGRVKEHQNEVNFYIGVEISQNLCAIMKLDCMDKIVDIMPRREELLRISGRKQKWSKSFMVWFAHRLAVVVRYGEFDWLVTYVCDETVKTSIAAITTREINEHDEKKKLRDACDGNKMETISCLGVVQLSWVLDLEELSLLRTEMKRDANMFFVGNVVKWLTEVTGNKEPNSFCEPVVDYLREDKVSLQRVRCDMWRAVAGFDFLNRRAKAGSKSLEWKSWKFKYEDLYGNFEVNEEKQITSSLEVIDTGHHSIKFSLDDGMVVWPTVPPSSSSIGDKMIKDLKVHEQLGMLNMGNYP